MKSLTPARPVACLGAAGVVKHRAPLRLGRDQLGADSATGPPRRGVCPHDLSAPRGPLALWAYATARTAPWALFPVPPGRSSSPQFPLASACAAEPWRSALNGRAATAGRTDCRRKRGSRDSRPLQAPGAGQKTKGVKVVCALTDRISCRGHGRPGLAAWQGVVTPRCLVSLWSSLPR